MTTVLIADASKPSVVMTSEIFKDKITGTLIRVASTGKDALEILKEFTPDICVVDFDLPDVDGPALVQSMRKVYEGPILLTAYPDRVVDKVVKDELFIYNDASAWIPKPVNFQSLSEKIDLFLNEGFRINKRFDGRFPAKIIAKAAGRGKRAPKVVGSMTNLSLGGACIEIEGTMKVKKSQELQLTISPPVKKGSKKDAEKNTALAETKIKATVAWHASKDKIGLQFCGLTNIQKNSLMEYMRYTTEQ